MASVYRNYVAGVEQTEFETAKINAYVARYQWFAAPALALLMLEVFLSTRAARSVKQPPPATAIDQAQPAKPSSSAPQKQQAA
jgi:Ca-activated chloride channel family protein